MVETARRLARVDGLLACQQNPRVSVVISWLGAALVTAAGAHDAPPLEFEWQAPAGCPDRAWALERLASDPRTASVESPTSVLVRLSEGEGVFRAELHTSLRGVEGTRMLEAASCQELAEAILVVLGMALLPRPSEEAPPPQPPPVPTEPAHEPVAEPQGGSESSHAYFRAGIGIDSGSLPTATLGPVIAGGWSFGAFSLGLRGAYWLPQNREADPGTEAPAGVEVGGEFFQLDAAVLGCWSHPLSLAVALEGCLGVGGGLLRARGYGVPAPDTYTRFFGFGETELGLLLWRSAPVGLRLGLGLTVPMSRETYAIENWGPIYTPAPANFRGSLAAQVKF